MRSLFSGLALIVGLALAFFGTIAGYSNSPDDHFGSLLMFWLEATPSAAFAFFVAVAVGPKWARYIALTLLVLICVASVGPLIRLFTVGH